jgi:hypothetical protein
LKSWTVRLDSRVITKPKTGLNHHANQHDVTLALFDGNDVHGEPRVRIFDFATPKKSAWDNIAYENFEARLEAAKAESADCKSEHAEVDATSQD